MSYDFNLSRERMVKNQLITRGIKDERVLQVMGKIPRHLFIEDALYGEAYNDHPVPISRAFSLPFSFNASVMSATM